MHDDDIRRFIDGLDDARGFEQPTSAVDGWDVEGEPALDVTDWIHAALVRCLRRQLAFPEDPPFGVAVLEGTFRGRLYEQTPCETGTWFLERLSREAFEVRRPWVFVMTPSVRGFGVRTWQSWAAGSTATLSDGLDWYAELRGRGQREQLWGRATFDERGGSLWCHEASTPPRPLARILRGHPARRAEPIRPRR